MQNYKATAQRRRAMQQEQIAQRRARAWALAQQAARLLKERFGVERIAVFGSLARGNTFDLHSDLDLAVWGLAEKDYYHAVASVLALDAALEPDLVRVETALSGLRQAIEKEGVIL